MILLLFCLLTLQCPAMAKSARTVHLADGDMEEIYVEPGFSTLLKFRSHPEPGLIGDQDGFKVEYMRNIVAIKPLVTKGKTNLFVFTKEGQFNFQLVITPHRHDNLVYVEPRIDRSNAQSLNAKHAVAVDDLLTRRLNKSVTIENFRLSVLSMSTPPTRSTLVLKVLLEERLKPGKAPAKIEAGAFALTQGAAAIKIENTFLESKRITPELNQVSGLFLIRATDLKKLSNLTLSFLPSDALGKSRQKIAISFSADLTHR